MANELTASTRINAPGHFALMTRCKAGISLRMAVEVSLCVNSTPLMSGFLKMAASKTCGSRGCPHGTSVQQTSSEKCSAICPKRLANTPILNAKTLSPGENMLTMAASKVPLPDDGKSSTSFSDCNTYCNPSVI